MRSQSNYLNDGRTEGRTDARTDRRTDRRTWATLNALPHSTNSGGITSQLRGRLVLFPTASPYWFRSSSTSGDLAVVVLGFVGSFGAKFAADGHASQGGVVTWHCILHDKALQSRVGVGEV